MNTGEQQCTSKIKQRIWNFCRKMKKNYFETVNCSGETCIFAYLYLDGCNESCEGSVQKQEDGCWWMPLPLVTILVEECSEGISFTVNYFGLLWNIYHCTVQ